MARTQESVLCLSHLRWNFIYQRPQHLLGRCARHHRVVFFEQPKYDATEPELELDPMLSGVTVAIPHLAPGTPPDIVEYAQRKMIDRILSRELDNARPVLWYYAPMSLAFTHHVKARAVVYDCVDEPSAYDDTPTTLLDREQLLLAHADVVFTSGYGLYEHKRATTQHRNLYPFLSSVDVVHFIQARHYLPEPADQAVIPHPRVGYYGVIDDRIDLALLAQLADLRPDLQLVMLGPVVKLEASRLPQRPNLHWLGGKSYEQLPAYLCGWDVGMLPFVVDDTTRFLSPSRTPEYLAAGKPVVSTAVIDVVKPYGDEGLAWIADGPRELSQAIDEALASDTRTRTSHADAFLAELSWDRTWREMWTHVERAIANRAAARPGSGSSAQSVPSSPED